MKYSDYKYIKMVHDDATVEFQIDVWDFDEIYADESKLLKETFPMKMLDDHIDSYLMNGFAVVEQIPKY